MKNTFLVILTLAVIVVLVFLLFLRSAAPKATIPSVSSSSPASASSSSIKFYEVVRRSSGGQNFSDRFSSIVNTSTGAIVSFKNFAGAGGSGNVNADMYVDGRKVGTTGGLAVLEESFSPDNKYFVMLFDADGGASSFLDGIDYVDVRSSTSTVVGNPQVPLVGCPSASRQIDISRRIESYLWDGNSAVDLTAYCVGAVYNEQANTLTYYRVSPKQIWRYELPTRIYSLVQVLSDSSSTSL